jgi:uncharacterized protein YcfJ
MATYRIQRLFSKWEEFNDKNVRFQHKHPKLSYLNPIGDQAEAAFEESMRTKKTSGKKAKRYVKNQTILGSVGDSIIGAAGGAALGGKKGAAIGGAIGAVTGAGTGYLMGKSLVHSGAYRGKKMAGYRTDRWLDNMKVADGKMSEEEFNKKWKKS